MNGYVLKYTTWITTSSKMRKNLLFTGIHFGTSTICQQKVKKKTEHSEKRNTHTHTEMGKVGGKCRRRML